MLLGVEAISGLGVRPVGLVGDAQVFHRHALTLHVGKKGPHVFRHFQLHFRQQRGPGLPTSRRIMIRLHPTRRRVERGAELHVGTACERGFADFDGVLAVGESLVLEVLLVGIVVVILRLVVVADVKVQKVCGHLLEHGVVEFLLRFGPAPLSKTGDMRLVINGTTPHSLKHLTGMSHVQPDGRGILRQQQTLHARPCDDEGQQSCEVIVHGSESTADARPRKQSLLHSAITAPSRT